MRWWRRSSRTSPTRRRRSERARDRCSPTMTLRGSAGAGQSLRARGFSADLSRRAAGRAAVSIATCAMLVACNVLPSVRGSKEAAQNADAQRLQLLQLQVMRFADEYAGRLVDPVTQFKRDTSVPEERLAAQSWLLSQTNSAYTIASGPNPSVNALDMIVLATLSRMVAEDSFVAERFGERAVPLRDAHRALEPRAWTLVQEILTEEQREKLRQVLEEWRARNPQVRSVAYIHFHDFAKSLGHPTAEEAKAPGSLFGLIGIDPLSKLDPAVR